jgi:hypothetical protein
MEAARPIDPEITEVKAPVTAQAPPPAAMTKNPFVAGLLSGFPGIGNIYNGLYLRGAIFFTAIACLLALGSGEDREHPVLGFVVAFVWIFNVLDAYRQAKLINLGIAQDLGQEDLPRLPKAGQGGLMAGVLLILLGVVASLQLYLGIDLSWMLKFWPLAVIAFGAWLVFSWTRERAKRDEGDEKLS